MVTRFVWGEDYLCSSQRWPTKILNNEDYVPVTFQNVDEVINYHRPTDEQLSRVQDVRNATTALIQVILMSTPECGDRQAAIRHAREAMMTANAAIVLDGLV